MKNRYYKIWTQEELNQIIILFQKGYNYNEISKKTGRTPRAIRNKLNKLKYFQSVRSKKIREKFVYEIIICKNCNKEFKAYRKDKQKFCSQSCAAIYNNKTRELKPLKDKDAICVECGTKIKIKRYASLKTAKCKKCNPNYGCGRNKYIKDVKKINNKYICKNCGKTLKRKGKYCSINCQAEFRRNEIFKKIESGDNSLNSRNYKNYLIYKYGEKCMECGWNKRNLYSKKIPIEIEHIDGNSNNNDLSNLKLLCPNCHSLTPTYKALNAGNGRYKRRVRYKEGKSF